MSGDVIDIHSLEMGMVVRLIDKKSKVSKDIFINTYDKLDKYRSEIYSNTKFEIVERPCPHENNEGSCIICLKHKIHSLEVVVENRDKAIAKVIRC